MANCNQCQQNNVCAQCTATFVSQNSGQSCACPDSSFVITSTGSDPSASNACTCPTGTTLSSSHCYQCNPQFCTLCQQDNVCSSCTSPFVVTSTGTCSCPPTYVLVNGNNCQCPDSSYVIQSNACVCPSLTTLSGGTCVACNVQYCTLCQSANVCSTCQNNLVPGTSSGKSVCICPDNTFVLNINTNTCVCPSGTLQQISSLGAPTCVACSIQYCATCPTLSTCTACNQNFVLAGDNSVCSCAATYVFVNNACVCPNATTQFNGACVACNVTNCQLCQTANVCQTCAPTYLLSTTNNNCVCPVTFTEYNSVCYQCTLIQHCSVCNNTNICNQCQQSFTLSSTGTCVCAANTTLYNSQCIQCQIQGCQLC